MTKQRARRVGLGMKPRDSDVAKEAVLSAAVVQVESPIEASVEVVDGNSEGEGLDLSPVQNLESKPQEEVPVVESESIVAQSTFSKPPSAIPQEHLDYLKEMLLESEEVTGANPSFIDPDPREFAGIEVTKMISFEEAKKWVGSADLSKEGAEAALAKHGFAKTGELPNGEYRATVRIAEPYVEGCRQQAESDGISLEDWLTGHLHSYLEAWWGAPGSR